MSLTVADVLLKEYELLKREQGDRIRTRDHLFIAMLTAVAAVVAATLGSHGTALLLLLPPVVIVIGWTFLINDQKISAAGRHIRTDTAPRLAWLLDSEPVLGWETAHRCDVRRRERKTIQLGIDLIAFWLPAQAAIWTYWLNGPWSWTPVLISILEAVASFVLGAQIIIYSAWESERS